MGAAWSRAAGSEGDPTAAEVTPGHRHPPAQTDGWWSSAGDRAAEEVTPTRQGPGSVMRHLPVIAVTPVRTGILSESDSDR